MPKRIRESGASNHWLDRLCSVIDHAGSSLRVVVIVAHPDDEVIGAGMRLSLLRHAVVICVTDGAPRDMRDAAMSGFTTRDAYAAARRSERAAALEIAGADVSRIYELGVVDQEASRQLVEVALQLESLLARLRPQIALTHAYEGGHPDHDAVAFAVHAAVMRLRRSDTRAPAVLEFPSYHARDGGMVTGEFATEPGSPERDVYLSGPERALKRRMYDCFVTQQRMLALFGTDVERFRAAPHYDFRAPPRTGVALYDALPWGVRSGEWRELACEAGERLGLTSES